MKLSDEEKEVADSIKTQFSIFPELQGEIKEVIFNMVDNQVRAIFFVGRIAENDYMESTISQEARKLMHELTENL